MRTSVEGARGCGYRKPGGIYLVGGSLSEPCPRLPLAVETCPTCGAGVKPARGFTWIDPRVMFPAEEHGSVAHNARCPLGLDMLATAQPAPDPRHRCGERAGLLWIGEAFYPTPESFVEEAARMGVSRRIAHVPKDFEVGVTWVFMGHRKAIRDGYVDPETEARYPDLAAVMDAGLPGDAVEQAWRAGVVTLFRPTAIEYVVRPEEEDDEEFLADIERRGLTPVKVVRDVEAMELPL